MKSIRFRDKLISFQVEGAGAPVVLLHGFCEDQRIWDDFKTDLIGTGYKVVTIDLPGFGNSEVPLVPSIAYMAEGVNAVLNHLDILHFIIIGHSMGGYVSLAYGEKYSDNLSGLGLFHSHCFEDSAEKKGARKKSIDFVKEHGVGPYVKQVIPSLFAADFFIQNAPVISDLTEKAGSYAPGGVINALQAMHDKPDQSEILKQISVPVLFIIGKKDLVTPFDLCIEQTHYPEKASIHVLEEAGHMGMFEATGECQKILRDFVGYCLQKNNSGR